MKNLVLFTALLMGLTTVAAEKNLAEKGKDLTNKRYTFSQPIQFVERGVEFLIFPDGSFDFNTNPNDTNGTYYFKTAKASTKTTTTARRGNPSTTYGASVNSGYYNIPGGTIVTHDFDGKVRRVGNVFINYNRFGQVKRLGSVYVNYNRFGMLKQVGGLHIQYDRFGNVTGIFGQVNRPVYHHSLISFPYNSFYHSEMQSGFGFSNHTDFYYKSEIQNLDKEEKKSIQSATQRK